MLLHLRSVLPDDAAGKLAASLAAADFVDGRLTASDPERSAKRNLQIPRGSALADAAGDAVLRALLAHPDFVRAAHPRAAIRPQFARYDVGMCYGRHVDSAIMTDGIRVRSDLSVTMFLSDKRDYEGGELVIETDAGEARLRCDRGDVVLYPSTTVHEVTPVTRGTRLVAVTWIESAVRDAARRKLLYDLAVAMEAISATLPGSETLQTLAQCHENLLRMWAD